MQAQISCRGRTDIAGLADLRADMLKAFGEHDDVVLAVEDVDQAHFAFLQLVEAARLHAADMGKTIRLSGALGSQPNAALDMSGLLSGRNQDDLAFWHREESIA